MGSCMSANRSDNKITPGDANGPAGGKTGTSKAFFSNYH